MVARGSERVHPVPAHTAVVAETDELATEEGTGLEVTRLTQRILQVRVYLHLETQIGNMLVL